MSDTHDIHPWAFLRRIVSGGQTGVDRAVLDFALEHGIECGGWCPNGRLAEDGPIDNRYPLTETPSSDYRQRTLWNVRDSDATLIFHLGAIEGGTLYTVKCAKRFNRPFQTVDLADPTPLETIRVNFEKSGVITLNFAGPRENSNPGIYNKVMDLLTH